MICPSKNSKEWQEDVRKYGEAAAYRRFFAQQEIKTGDPLQEVRTEIHNQVLGNEEYYAKKYAPFLRPLLGNRLDAESMTIAFTQRFDGLSPKINGDIVETTKGNYLLFPEVDTEYSEVIDVPSAMDIMLHSLKAKFGIPFVVINDTSQKFAGRYVNQGEKKIVVINVAYATDTTPLHEYYHPFVRALRLRNPSLFAMIAARASLVDKREDVEEVVTDYLSENAKANKDRSYLEQFWYFIKKLLRIKVEATIDNATTLSDVFNILSKGIDVTKENTLTSAYKKVDDIIKGIQNKITDRRNDIKIDFIENLKKNSAKFTTSDQSNFYQNENGVDVAKRLTAFIGDRELGEFAVKGKNKKYTRAEWEARQIFKLSGKDLGDTPVSEITDSIQYNGDVITFQKLLEAVQKEFNKGQVYGKMVHSFMQMMLERDVQKKAQIRDQALQYAGAYGKPFTELEKHPDLRHIALAFDDIMERAGLVADPEGIKGIPKSQLDKVAPEVTLISDLLVDSDNNPIGTTADGIFQHYNNEVSLIDWKTGYIASDMNTAYLMKYGAKYGLADSKLNRGYLELAFRTMILKEHNPEMRFRNIRIVKLNKDGSSQNMDLDLQPFLYTIGEYYKQNKPEVYAKLQEKNLLAASEYEGVGEDLIKVFSSIAHLPMEEQLLYLKTKLGALHANKTKQEIERDPTLSKLSSRYTNAILEIEKIPGLNLNAKTADLPFIGGLKNFSDISNPKIQTLHKIMLEAKDRIRHETSTVDEQHDKLYQELLKDKRKPRVSRILSGGALAGVTYGLFTLQFLPFAGGILAYKILSRNLANTREHFDFMWRESKDVGRPGFYMNTEDSYIDTKGNLVEMTQAQKNYRDFVHKSMADAYEKFAHKVVEYRNGDESRPVYMYERLELPPVLPPDFMPRIPKPIEELREEESFTSNFFGLKTTIGASVKNYLTSFIEDTYEDTSSPIPLRYFKHDGSSVVQSQAHSFNVEASFKSFMAALHYKDKMDPVKDLFIGVSNALSEEMDESRNSKYPNTVEWLDKEFYTQVLEKSKEVAIRSKKWQFTAGAKTEFLTGIPKGTQMFISQDRVLRAIKTSVTYTVMSFKVWSPIRNAIMIGLQNITQATRQPINNILSKIIGVPPETFEGISAKAAHPVFVDFLKAKISGKEDDSKLWNIAKKFDWLPDNYGSYTVNNDRLLSEAIKLSPTSHAFMFYQMGETMGALWQLAGLMQGTKIVVDGKEISMWDAYDNKGNWTAGSRGQVESSPGVFKDLTELDALEIKSLKRAYEKLNGSYRREEKTAIEATVLGEFLFQFKKYFYQYLKVLFADPYKDITVGKYVMSGKRPDGMPVYQWHSDIMEGQMRVLVGAIIAGATLKPGAVKEYLSDTSKFGENTLKGHRARALGAAINTLIWYALLLTVFFTSLDDDEEKSYAGRALRRTIDDLSRGLSPTDLFGNLEKPVVASEKIAKLGAATMDFMMEGMWGKQNSDGWPKGLKTIARSTPGISAGMQLKDLFKVGGEEVNSPFSPSPLR